VKPSENNPEEPLLLSGATALPPTFVDRESERRRLREGILNGESLVIEGPPGIGKTALLSEVIHSLPGELAARCLCVAGAKDFQDLLRRLIRALYEAEEPRLRTQLHRVGVSSLRFASWLKELPASRLRGTLYRAVEGGGYRVFLDHHPPLTQAAAKVIKELFWMRRTPMYLVPQAGAERSIARFDRFFYWGDRELLILGPLPRQAAKDLLESCIERFDLSQFDLTGFREEVLELSKHVPGAITKMCALAASPKYQYGSQIKVKSAYIDYLMTGHQLTAPLRVTNSRRGGEAKPARASSGSPALRQREPHPR
jgi:DNA polymerase III delta prime subunit